MARTTLLCILDGLGLNPELRGNAVALANTPNLDALFQQCSHQTLTTFGPRVGLPEGQMGNSEVGHLNIGAGRVVEQWLARIDREFREHLVEKSKPLQQFLEVSKDAPQLHLIGLFSSGGVHSHQRHLLSLIELLSTKRTQAIVLHLISDGRDTAPTQCLNDLEILRPVMKQQPNVRIGSISGRFFAMDRDQRWERTAKAVEAITAGDGPCIPVKNGEAALDKVEEFVRESYSDKITDEFLEPHQVSGNSFSQRDAAIFWNFRSDRMRQIVSALALQDCADLDRSVVLSEPTSVLTFSRYEEDFPFPVLFPAQEIHDYLGEVVSRSGLAQLRAAETEKYPHVTYFLNGGKEDVLPGEDRSLSPSPRDVRTYDQKPEMSAPQVTVTVVDAIRSKKYGLIVVNLANCDMVGHTGVLEAAIAAVEVTDSCLGQMIAALREVDGQALIIADHGNAEQMIDYSTGKPYTAHTMFPVPLILFGHSGKLRPGGALCDVAPTLLAMMDLGQPAAMTGSSLLS